MHSLLVKFYDQLSLSTSQQPFASANDASKSILYNVSMANASSFQHAFVRRKGAKGLEGDGEIRRHVERLLLRLDFNEWFSKARTRKGRSATDGGDILRDGGLG